MVGSSNLSGGTKIISTFFIQAAKARKEPLDHVLIFGPPGLGKTTLANIIANEMEVGIRHTSGPVLEKAGDVAALPAALVVPELHRRDLLLPAEEGLRHARLVRIRDAMDEDLALLRLRHRPCLGHKHLRRPRHTNGNGSH